MILSDFDGSGGTPERSWVPGLIFSENWTRKNPKPTPNLEPFRRVFGPLFQDMFLVASKLQNSLKIDPKLVFFEQFADV